MATGRDDDKAQKRFIIHTGPRERVTGCQAGSQSKTLSGQEAEGLSRGFIGVSREMQDKAE